MKNEKSFYIINLNIGDETIRDNLTISNHLNNFCTSVAKHLVRKYQKSFESCLRGSSRNSFLSHMTKEDIEDL